ncbi:hypothetical protein EOK75_00095 [Pseudorhodobacter turbinis]|uniref:Uncharacterized protein n=1 Tax=Pseudorhodobacter turbinis TaxID=2500533 RepID=A0A4P8EC86_9RHOB|nr:hypothetical protein [Pseudorhodobacter turbinis]QCO54372.1 hypothetical protein EOK75_00095 [Pseudorhodobacter turbinis]
MFEPNATLCLLSLESDPVDFSRADAQMPDYPATAIYWRWARVLRRKSWINERDGNPDDADGRFFGLSSPAGRL